MAETETEISTTDLWVEDMNSTHPGRRGSGFTSGNLHLLTEEAETRENEPSPEDGFILETL